MIINQISTNQLLEQLVASAEARVEEVIRRGVAHPKKIAVGGHSYGAFMTANLLAHAPHLFCCAIARSGAYNRTLTPFDFQEINGPIFKAQRPKSNSLTKTLKLLLLVGECVNMVGGGNRLKSVETMASQSAPPSNLNIKSTKLFFQNRKIPFAIGLLFADAIFVFLIICSVSYTKIDWDAYMSQVSGFLKGERDYRKLEGDTGPLSYPAGFLYVFSAFQSYTAGQVYLAQVLFVILYIINLAIVLYIYVKTDVVPRWALCLLSLSKRVHSIFVLRLFNDCVSVTIFHAALLLLMHRRWNLGLIVFSAAVSIKMDVLLYAPPLLILMLQAMDISGVLLALAGAALVQILLGLPFLVSYPVAYITRAFNLGRVFVHFWSVNFKFIPEPIFLSKGFAIFLLAAHLTLLALFAHYRWCRHEGGLLNFLNSRYVSMRLRSALLFSSYSKKFGKSSSSPIKVLTKEHIVTTMFVGNFIGILCARSLHYQFYSWYFFSLPYMLWITHYPTFLRLILFVGVEYCWNIYPSNTFSSALLLCLHLVILWGLWSAPPQHPYAQDESSSHKQQ